MLEARGREPVGREAKPEGNLRIPAAWETRLVVQLLQTRAGRGPSSESRSVGAHNYVVTIVYDTQIMIFRWGCKPQNITGGQHPVLDDPWYRRPRAGGAPLRARWV